MDSLKKIAEGLPPGICNKNTAAGDPKARRVAIAQILLRNHVAGKETRLTEFAKHPAFKGIKSLNAAGDFVGEGQLKLDREKRSELNELGKKERTTFIPPTTHNAIRIFSWLEQENKDALDEVMEELDTTAEGFAARLLQDYQQESGNTSEILEDNLTGQ